MPELTDPIPRSEVLDLLAAIREAVDVPRPGLSTADERLHQRLMVRRLSDLRIHVAFALTPQLAGPLDPSRLASLIRESTAATPVTYSVWTPPGRDSAGALAEQRHQLHDPAVPPMGAAGPCHVMRRCPTSGCGSTEGYLDLAVRGDTWVRVQTGQRPAAVRWYCRAACAAEALTAVTQAPGVAR